MLVPLLCARFGALAVRSVGGILMTRVQVGRRHDDDNSGPEDHGADCHPLNAHPEKVTDDVFLPSVFCDMRDRVQVKS